MEIHCLGVMQRFFSGTNQIVPYSTCIRVEADRDFSNYRNMTSFRFLDFNGKNLTVFVQCIEMCNSKLLVNREIGLEITKLAPHHLETFSISITCIMVGLSFYVLSLFYAALSCLEVVFEIRDSE